MMGWRCRNSASANRKHCIPITTGRHKKHGCALRNGLFCPQSQCDGATSARFFRTTSLSSAQSARRNREKPRNAENPYEIRAFYMHLSAKFFCGMKNFRGAAIALRDFFNRDQTKKHQPKFFLHKHEKSGFRGCRGREIWTNRRTSDSLKLF
jgi:hypothetical protein